MVVQMELVPVHVRFLGQLLIDSLHLISVGYHLVDLLMIVLRPVPSSLDLLL